MQLRPRRLRTKLLLSVNALLALLFAVLVAADAARERRHAFEERRSALAREAVTLLDSILRLEDRGPGMVEDYIESVCSSAGTFALGHVIEARLDGKTFRSHAPSAPPDLFEGAAPPPPGWIVGRASAGRASVAVAQGERDLIAQRRVHLWTRAAAIMAVGIAGAGLVSFLLVRWVDVPLRRLAAAVESLGRGDFSARPSEASSREFAVLAAGVAGAAAALQADAKRRSAAMAKARRIQQRLLPEVVSHPGLALAHAFLPAEEVGGDFFEVASLPDGACFLAIGDASGHGVPAAMAAAALKVILDTERERGHRPDALMRAVDRRFRSVAMQEDFATLAIVRLDPATGRFSMASAGHEPILLRRGGRGGRGGRAEGRVETLPPTGPLLGVVEPGPEFGLHEGVLRPGDVLVLLTDGVPESRVGKGLLGRAAIGDALMGLEHASPESVLEALRARLARCEQTDDVTIVAAALA
jgi:phosphoserine phosphatase RsbU/P